MFQDSYKGWIDKSIRGGYIHCCIETDIELDPLQIGHGSIIYKAMIKEESRFGKHRQDVLG